MTTFVNSISGVLVILVMVMVGYVLAKKVGLMTRPPL